MGDLLSNFFGGCVNFHSRTSRRDFWLTFLLLAAIYLVLGVLLVVGSNISEGFIIAGILLSLFFTIASLAMQVRRLHDVGRSGAYLFLSLIPVVGSIILLVWFCKPSEMKINKWGAPGGQKVNNTPAPEPEQVEPLHTNYEPAQPAVCQTTSPVYCAPDRQDPLIIKFFKGFTDFHSRTSRRDFWLTFLLLNAIYLVLGGLLAIGLYKIPQLENVIFNEVFIFFAGALSIFLTIPSLSIQVRRLHDVGRSGACLLLLLIPIVGAILVLVWLCGSSEQKVNKWGAPADPNVDKSFDDSPKSDVKQYDTLPSASLFVLFKDFVLRFVDFKTRSSRRDFWMTYLLIFIFILFCLGLYVVAWVASPVLGGLMLAIHSVGMNAPFGVIWSIVYCLALVPFFAISVRRLHDIGKSGWLALLLLIPIAGTIAMIVLWCLPSDPKINKWGAPMRMAESVDTKWKIWFWVTLLLPLIVNKVGADLHNNRYNSRLGSASSSPTYDSSSNSSSSTYDSYSNSSSSQPFMEPGLYFDSDVPVDPSEILQDQIIESDFKWVDLGLPSGTLWSDLNVGANSFGEIGFFYPHDVVRYLKRISTANSSSLRMPSVKHFKELRNHCEWQWRTSYNGFNTPGYLVTGSNGNSIYLPAAGNIKDETPRRYGIDGDYWAADTKGSSRAYNLDFSESTITPNDNSPETMLFSLRLILVK